MSVMTNYTTPSVRGQLAGWGTETEFKNETKWGSNSQGSGESLLLQAPSQLFSGFPRANRCYRFARSLGTGAKPLPPFATVRYGADWDIFKTRLTV